MRVNSQDSTEALAHFCESLQQTAGERAAIGITQAENVSAGIARGIERLQGVVRVGEVSVEEVLSVVDHFLAMVLEILHRLRDELEILLFGDAEGALHVEVPGLAENGDR